MFRMGKNPREEKSEKPAAPETPHTQPFNAQPAPQAPVAPEPPSPPPVAARPAFERQASTSRAVTEAETLAQEIKDGSMSGFVGGSTSLSGKAAFKGMLRVDGHLSGSVSSDKGTLIVSSGGQVDASIEVAVAKINGTVNGDIIATERIELGRTARLHGDIYTPALVIEQGAIFDGACHMNQTAPPARVEQPNQTVAASSSSNNNRSTGSNTGSPSRHTATPDSQPSTGSSSTTPAGN